MPFGNYSHLQDSLQNMACGALTFGQLRNWFSKSCKWHDGMERCMNGEDPPEGVGGQNLPVVYVVFVLPVFSRLAKI